MFKLVQFWIAIGRDAHSNGPYADNFFTYASSKMTNTEVLRISGCVYPLLVYNTIFFAAVWHQRFFKFKHE